MQLHPLEFATMLEGDFASGFLAVFPSGAAKQIVWRTGAPIEPTVDAGKKYAAALIEALSKDALFDDMERTNWASAVAAIQKIVGDFNDKLRVKLYANAAPVQ